MREDREFSIDIDLLDVAARQDDDHRSVTKPVSEEVHTEAHRAGVEAVARALGQSD